MSHQTAVGVFTGLCLAIGGGARSQDATGARECPMHAAHQAASAGQERDHHARVDERHDHATGVAQADSIHHFTLDPQGGTIRLEVVDAADESGRGRIRAHLSGIAREFAKGRFDLPMMIHGRTPPGVPAMRRLATAIRYRYQPTDRGGRIDITTANAEAVAAIHEFLRFQIEDHRTGDPVDVRPRI